MVAVCHSTKPHTTASVTLILVLLVSRLWFNTQPSCLVFVYKRKHG